MFGAKTFVKKLMIIDKEQNAGEISMYWRRAAGVLRKHSCICPARRRWGLPTMEKRRVLEFMETIFSLS